MRVIVPEQFQKRLIEEMHEGHIGMCRKKALARSFMWWSNIDSNRGNCKILFSVFFAEE
jgi:hypothetical protein